MSRIVVFFGFVFFFILTYFFFIEKEKSRAQIGVYHWESYFSSNTELIDSNNFQKIYQKFFEIGLDESSLAIPIDKYGNYSETISLNDLSLIPCVYLQNEVLKKISKSDRIELAKNTLYLIRKKYKEKFIGKPLSEIQIDCDWTLNTANQYCHFIDELKSLVNKENLDIDISITLRLYAYKFYEKMKVPNADKAMLLCYNILPINEAKNRNSILDFKELNKYLDKKINYPLPLDLCLPTYTNVLYFQQNRLVEMNHYLSEYNLEFMDSVSKLWFKVKTNSVIYEGEHMLSESDQIKVEKITPNELLKCLEILDSSVGLKNFNTLNFFDLDAINYQSETFTHEEISRIIHRF